MDTYHKRRFATEVLLVIVVAFLLSYTRPFPAKASLRELEQTYLTVGIAEGTLAVDTAMAHYGYPVEGVRRQERTYLTTPPGLAYVASVPFRVFYDTTALPDLKELRLFLDRVVGLPLAILFFLGLRRLLRTQLVDESNVDLGSIGLVVGTPFFALGGMLNATSFTILLLTLAWLAMHRLETRPHSATVGTLLGFGIGAALGWAAVSHPLGAMLGLIIAIAALTGPIRYHRPAAIALLFGASGGWVFWAYLNVLLTDTWHGLTFRKLEIDLATIDLFNLGEGVFWTAPFLVLAPVGFVVLWRRGLKRFAVSCVGVSALALGLAYSTQVTDGLTLGVFALGLLAVHAVDALDQTPLTFGLSRGLVTTAVVVFAILGMYIGVTPPYSGNVWEALNDFVQSPVTFPNLGQELGIDGRLSTMPGLGLIGALALFLMVRGVTDLPGSKQRLMAGGAALVVTIVSLGAVTQFGGRWTSKNQTHVLKRLSPLHHKQRGLRDGMNQVIRDIDGMNQ